MTNLPALRGANANRWAAARMTRAPEFAPVAARLAAPAAKARYMMVAARTRVPWFVVAVIHERECSQNWGGSLAQGDPWTKVSVHVPAGRGPFKSWEDAAVDALVNCAPYAARNKDWSVGGTLTLLEQYNGLGYASRGVASPYVWAGTDQCVSGKYVRDGVYDPSVIDRQLGCAGLVLAMMAIDASIKFGLTGASDNAPKVVVHTGQVVVPAHPESVPAKPSITHPAPGSVGAGIASLFKKAA
jgi:lysozyme family protein